MDFVFIDENYVIFKYLLHKKSSLVNHPIYLSLYDHFLKSFIHEKRNSVMDKTLKAF